MIVYLIKRCFLFGKMVASADADLSSADWLKAKVFIEAKEFPSSYDSSRNFPDWNQRGIMTLWMTL